MAQKTSKTSNFRQIIDGYADICIDFIPHEAKYEDFDLRDFYVSFEVRIVSGYHSIYISAYDRSEKIELGNIAIYDFCDAEFEHTMKVMDFLCKKEAKRLNTPY